MLFCLIFFLPFILVGLIFGIVSPICALCTALGEESNSKWQMYIQTSTKMSETHEACVRGFAGGLAALNCECADAENRKATRLYLGYYKLGHTIGVCIHMIFLTFFKIILFVPFFSSCCTSEPPESVDSAHLVRDKIRARRDSKQRARTMSRQSQSSNASGFRGDRGAFSGSSNAYSAQKEEPPEEGEMWGSDPAWNMDPVTDSRNVAPKQSYSNDAYDNHIQPSAPNPDVTTSINSTQAHQEINVTTQEGRYDAYESTGAWG